MSVIETGKAADEGHAELNIFLRGDPDDPGEPDDPGRTKIYFESLIWIWSYSGK